MRTTRSDRLYAVIVIVAALVVSSAPYIAGYAAQTSNAHFSGAFFDQDDFNSHLAKMQLGSRGEWQFRLLFTPEEQTGNFLQMFYIVLGHIARWSHLPLPLVYQLARIVCGALFLAAAYRFFALFEPSSSVLRLALALVAFSSGLGWLVPIVAPANPSGISPIDFWLIDANSFFSLMLFPHFTAAIALLLEILRRLIGQLRPGSSIDLKSDRMSLAVTAVYTFLLVPIHPYAVAEVLVPAFGMSIVQVIRRRSLTAQWWRLIAAVMAGAALPLLYSVSVFLTDPVLKQWAAQNVTLSPPPLYYALGFGLVLVFAVLGARRFVRECQDRAVFVLIWIGVTCVLVYLPVGIQRRFIEGVHVPLCLMAAYGLMVLSERLAARASFVVINLLVAVAAMSNVYMVIGYTTLAAKHSDRLFRSVDEFAAMDWLEANSRWRDTVLASESVGSLIPGRIGHRVVLGHWAETLDYRGKREAVASFFGTATSDQERRLILDRWSVRFVFYGPDERRLGSFEPSQVPFLTEAFHSGDVAVYRVELP